MRCALLTCLALCLVLNTATAADAPPSNRLSLFFPIDKNNIQILPQRFEYELIDKDQFRVGNAFFDARNFKFEVHKLKDVYKFSLHWPAGLLSNGEISIRDNIGKAIWIQPIDGNKIKFSKLNTDASVSAMVASLDDEILPTKTINALRYVPYFRMCVQKIAPPVRVSLCSKDFYIRPHKDKIDIQTRDSLRNESYVNINGNNVDHRGLIFLQNFSDILALRVLLLSGATLDLDTRMKQIDFRDLSISEDGKSLQIWAAGAEPTGNQKVLRVEDGSWKTEVNYERPIIYLKGEGDIPMKQEFITQGAIREQKLTIEALSPPPTITYSSSVTIPLKKLSGGSMQPADNLSTMEDQDETTVNWNLNELANWTKNRRLLKVAFGNRQFTAAWDLEKFPPWEARISAFLPAAGRIGIRRWFNNLRLGAGLDYKYILSPFRSGDGNSSRLRLPFYLHWNRSIQFSDSGWGLFLSPEQRLFGNTSTTGAVAGLFFHSQMPPGWSYLGQWNHTEADLFGTGTGATTFAGQMGFRTDFLYKISKNQYWHWGLEYTRGTLKDELATPTETVIGRAELEVGFGYLF